MNRLEIIACPKDRGDVRAEFQRFLSRAIGEGWTELKVLFGHAWGIRIYEKEWIEEIMTPEVLAERVAAAEAGKVGEIGWDDLFVTPLALGVEHVFCHEGDVHLKGPEDAVYIATEAERLKLLGWIVRGGIENVE